MAEAFTGKGVALADGGMLGVLYKGNPVKVRLERINCSQLRGGLNIDFVSSFWNKYERAVIESTEKLSSLMKEFK